MHLLQQLQIDNLVGRHIRTVDCLEARQLRVDLLELAETDPCQDAGQHGVYLLTALAEIRLLLLSQWFPVCLFPNHGVILI